MASYTRYFVCEETRDAALVIFFTVVSVHIAVIPLMKITCDIAHANSHVIYSNARALVAHAVGETIFPAFKRHRSESRLDLSIRMYNLMATAVVHTFPHQKAKSYYQPDLYGVANYTCNWVTAVWHS